MPLWLVDESNEILCFLDLFIIRHQVQSRIVERRAEFVGLLELIVCRAERAARLRKEGDNAAPPAADQRITSRRVKEWDIEVDSVAMVRGWACRPMTKVALCYHGASRLSKIRSHKARAYPRFH